MHLLIEKTVKSATSYFQDFFIHEYSKKTYLHDVHPSIKLLGTLAFIVMSVSTFEIKKILLILAAVYVLALNTGLDVKVLAKRSVLFAVFSFFIVLPVSVFERNIAYLITFPLRVFASISSLQLFILTTRFSEVLYGLKKLRVPGMMIDVIWLTYRYTISMFRDLLNILIAREARRLKKSDHIETIRGGSRSLGLFLLRSFEKAEEIELAMNARGKRIIYRGKYQPRFFYILYTAGVVAWWMML